MLPDLRNVLTGAWIRAVAGIRDVGEIIKARIGNDEGAHFGKDGTDAVWVESQDVLTETGRITDRLFFAANALFRLPRSGDLIMSLHPGDARGPGNGLALHGDGHGQVPDWLDEQTCGISIDKEHFRIDVKGDGAEIKITTKNTELKVDADGNVTLKVPAGKTVMLGDENLIAADGGLVLASGIDSFTGSTYGALNNASTVVMAKKT